jgi:predicted DCC family thiol-disulfide oxidoreductase YuxK
VKHRHLILFDSTCPLCRKSVDKVRAWDQNEQFQYSPILGEKAKRVLKGKWKKFKNANTLVLIEDHKALSSKIWIKGRAVMRILWLLGGWKKLLGWLSYMPLGVDQVYAFIAKRRHRF